MKAKSVFAIIYFLLCPMVGLAQTTQLNELMQKDTSPIDSLVKSSIFPWLEAVNFYLTTETNLKKYDYRKDFDTYMKIFQKRFDGKETFQVFMCNDSDDDIYVIYSTGQKRRILPTITMTFIDISSGKSFQKRYSIRKMLKFLEKTQCDVDHIDVTSIQVYLVDKVKKQENHDNIGKFCYYAEHIFATADYQIINDIYEMKNMQSDSFYINRGKSYWGTIRNEEHLLQVDNVVVILGDVNLNVFINKVSL